MGFFLTDLLQNALTPGGTNEKRSQENQQKQVAGINFDLLKKMIPGIENEIDFQNNWARPEFQAALQRMASMMKQQNIQGRTEAVRRGVTSNANRQGRMAEAQYGEKSSIARGVRTGAINRGTVTANQYLAEQYDPRVQAELQKQIIGLTQMAQPNLSSIGNLSAGVYGRPGVQVQPGFGEILGGLAGQYAQSQMIKKPKDNNDYSGWEV